MKSLRHHTAGSPVLALAILVMLWTIVPQGVCLRELFTRDCGCCAEAVAMACCCTQPEPGPQAAHEDDSCELCFTPDNADTTLPRLESPDFARSWAILPHIVAVADHLPMTVRQPWHTVRSAGLSPPPPLVLRI